MAKARPATSTDVFVEPEASIEVAGPRGVRFIAPYGFCDAYGDRWSWHPNQEVRNPYVLELLSARRAPVVEIEE